MAALTYDVQFGIGTAAGFCGKGTLVLTDSGIEISARRDRSTSIAFRVAQRLTLCAVFLGAFILGYTVLRLAGRLYAFAPVTWLWDIAFVIFTLAAFCGTLFLTWQVDRWVFTVPDCMRIPIDEVTAVKLTGGYACGSYSDGYMRYGLRICYVDDARQYQLNCFYLTEPTADELKEAIECLRTSAARPEKSN